ncbi:MAG: hypothetical protein L3J23_03330 [Flavobacteriaceae bacterium]|nr:hypothetical protein [Flavobacteriaceae bacterium]
MIYNIYFIITFFFYFLFYKKILKKSKNIKRINLFLILYSLFTIFDLIFLKSSFTNGFITNNIVFGAILLIITLILFLIEIINDEKIIFNIEKLLIFWISIGVLLFHIGVIPIIISSEILKYDGIYDRILLGLNIIMYGSFIIGFICSDPKYNY